MQSFYIIADKPCPKCGNANSLKSTYVEATTITPEYLNWTCRNCGYAAQTKVKDKSTP